MEYSKAIACPELTLLRRYLHGESKDVDAEAIDHHVSNCSICQNLLEGMMGDGDNDSLGRLLRQRGQTLFRSARCSIPFFPMRMPPQLLSRPEPERSSQPERIGEYQVVGELGRGSYGIVYQAIDERLDRMVAIKVPRSDAVRSAGGVESFLKEARALARLEHPNIVHVYEVSMA